MLIGLLSDTHIGLPNKTLPHQIKDAFRGVDIILHAGDIWIPSVLDELESVAPVIAAWGDDDIKADFASDKRMLDGHRLQLDGVTLWLTHVKPRYGLIRPTKLPHYARAGDEKPEETPDIVVFGHTHRPAIEHYQDAILVNPGSATLPGYEATLGTVAMLKIDGGEIDARIVQLA